MMIGMRESGRDNSIPEMVWKRVTERKERVEPKANVGNPVAHAQRTTY